MHFNIRAMLSVAAAAALTFSSYAIPAKPGVLQYTNPDGSSVDITISGDEHGYHYSSTDGYVLVPSSDGTMCYATLKDNKLANSHIKASDINIRSSSERALLASLDAPSMRRMAEKAADSQRRKVRAKAFEPGNILGDYPTTGSPNVLILLVQFQDVKFKDSNDKQAFENLLNKTGYDFNGATGCAREYFEAQSNGVFSPNLIIEGPVTLPNNLYYYGAPGSDGNPDGRGWQMATDACKILEDENPDFDFARFDNDKDGFIDNIFIFYAGRGQHDGGADYTIWPHAWNIYKDLGLNYSFGGVKLGSYACANELMGSELKRNGIGVFCHEYSHILGLADHYPTGMTSHNNHPGKLDLMSEGPYLNDSNTPCNMSAFERYSLGWLNPRQLSGAEDIELKPLHSSNEALIINTLADNEFFILENRQNKDWDAFLPLHGMLVWHIDYDPDIWADNKPNNDANHQRVDVMEADGIPGYDTYAGDAFPGSNNITSITKWPTWTSTNVDMPLTNIHEDGGNIYFRVKGGGTIIDPVKSLEPTEVTATSFTANWETRGGLSYELDLCKGLSPVPVKTVTVAGKGSYTFTDLTPSTDYSYVVRAVDADLKSVDSERRSLRTDDPYFDMIPAEALQATEISKTGFTARWAELKDATAYILDVYQKDAIAPKRISIGFDNDRYPSDWYSNSTDYDGRRYGQSSPSLSLAANGVQMASPIFEDDINALSFWYRAYRPAETGFICIDIKKAGSATWQMLHAISPLCTDTEGATVKIGDGGLLLPTGVKAVRIVNRAPEGVSSAVYIDDITLDYAGTYTPVYVADYEEKNVGNVTSCTIDGLADNASYYYTVRGIDADGKLSPKSEEITVVTGATSGITDINGCTFKVSVSGGAILINGADANGAKVYSVDGLLVGSTTAANGAVRGLSSGIYIVVSGSNIAKVTLH